VRRLDELADLSVFGPYSTVGFERRNPDLHTHNRVRHHGRQRLLARGVASYCGVMLDHRKEKAYPGSWLLPLPPSMRGSSQMLSASYLACARDASVAL